MKHSTPNYLLLTASLLLALMKHREVVATPTTGVASTTRYWDCSGGSCGCGFAGANGEPTHCHSNAMFAAPEGNAFGAKYYGTAAISAALGGGNWMAEGCGRCFKVTGTSNVHGYADVSTTLVLMGTNFCPDGNPKCENGNPHFDISAPGFDFVSMSLSNTCPEREPEEMEGFDACGRWMIDSQNPDENCDCSKFKSPTLRAGCENFRTLYWTNVNVDYEIVECPSELARSSCWENNGHKWLSNLEDGVCAANTDANAASVVSSSAHSVTDTAGASWDLTTKSPTKAPVAATTSSPIKSPTKSPIKSPTKSPSKSPVAIKQTNSPVAAPTKSPTNPSAGSDSEKCCSTNYKTCLNNSWCDKNCDQCGGAMVDVTQCQEGGLAKYAECTHKPNKCCGPAQCTGSAHYKQCV